MNFKEFDKDYYKFLGIDRTANSHDIHRAFRQKSRLYHPDKGSGNEELMKLLTQCKQTLLDPDMKARYDDKYDPGNNHENDNDQDDLTDKLRLNCGQKLSDNYLKKLDEWTEEFAGISLVDNREFVNQKWLELRDKLTSNSDTIEHSISERDIYTGFLIKNKKDTLLNELKKLIPDNIWSLNDIQSGKFLFAGYNLFKLDIFINNHKMGDRYFKRGDYKWALYCYQKEGTMNTVLVQRAQELFKSNKYDDCLLYCRYVLNVNKYCPEVVAMILKITLGQILNQNNLDTNDQQINSGINTDNFQYKLDSLFEPIVCAAYHYRDEPEIQQLMFEQLVARELYMEARALLAENNTIVPAINRQLLVTIETTCEHQNSEALQALVNAYLFRDSARYILKHRCSKKIIDDICVDFAANKDQQSASYRAMLLVLRGCALLYEHDYHNSYESLRDALYVYPFEDCMDAVVLLLGAGHRESTIEHLLKFTSLENISPPPTDTHYAHMLKSHTTLRTLIKYERGIHSSKYSDDNMLVEKAMLYIDLCMAVASPILLANNMTMASNYLLQHMNTWLPDADQVDTYHARLYAYRNCICDLSGTALYFASRYLDPISVINYSAQIFSLMNSAHITLAKHIKLSKQSYNINGHNKRLLIDQDHQSLFNYTNSLLEKSIKVCPIVSMQLHSSSDILFVNMVNNEFLERYYTYYADNSKTLTHVYKYYLLEGSWKQWFPELMFVNRREHCMRALIRQKGLNINRIEAMMRWPTVRRDSSGWIDRRNLTLKLPGQTFTSVEGLKIDIEQGTFELLLGNNKGMPALINAADIDEVLNLRVTHSVFSLDPVSDGWDYDYHPFQRLRYSPGAIKDTHYLATLLHADYLLKMFTMGTEVSAHQPFPMRDGYSDAFLSVLSEELREDLRLDREGSTGISNYGQTHRFWIEAQELGYDETIDPDNGRRVIEFHECTMVVKEHLMKRDSGGALVDDTDAESDTSDTDSDDDTGERPQPHREVNAHKRFARKFTESYDDIGDYFPVFPRLRELLKLNAVALLLRGVYDGLEASKREVRVDEQQLRDVLGRLRAQIQYPLNTEAKVREIYRETLRENGISSDQVRESDKGELKRKIRQSLDNQETKVLDQLAQALNEGLELDSPQWLRKEIDKWLRRGNADKMTELLRQHITNNRINKLDRFAQNCKKLGMPFDGEHGICDDFATNGVNDWIPAAYSRTSHCRTYGGVCLIPRLVNVNEPRSGGESSANGGDYGHGGSKSNSGQRSSSNSRRNGGSSGGGGGGNGKKRKGRFKSQKGTKTIDGKLIQVGDSGEDVVHFIFVNSYKEGEELARSMSDKQANGKKIKVEFHSGVNKKKTEYYNPNRKGDKYAHFHPVDENGDKKGKVHICVRKKRR